MSNISETTTGGGCEGKRPVGERWERHLSTLLNVVSSKSDRVVIESIAQRLKALSPGDPPPQLKAKETLRGMTNSKATSPDGLLADRLKAWTDRGTSAKFVPFRQHHRCGLDIWRSAAGLKLCHCRSATEEGEDRVGELQGHLTRGTCWEDSPQNRSRRLGSSS